MARLLLSPVGDPLDLGAGGARQEQNRAHMAALDARLHERRALVAQGWGPSAAARVSAQGKLTAGERVQELKDPDAPLLPLGTFVNWGVRFDESSREAPGAGVITAFTRVYGRWVVVIANDNAVAAGAWWPRTPEKIQRAQRVALALRLPVVYLVESSGLHLPHQAETFASRTGAGGIFRMNSVLSAQGVPQVAGVFGPCIAGGGYMPIISDHVVMTEQAYMVIGGTTLLRGAKARSLTVQDLGGPEVHVHLSGCADERVPDDLTCIEAIRAHVGRLPTSAVPYHRCGVDPLPPRWPASDLSALFPTDHREPYDIRQVLARLVDGSLLHEVMAGTGPEVVTAVAQVSGLWVGLVANALETFPHPHNPDVRRSGGVLYREGVARISTFLRHCDEDGLPVLWFQDVAGFDIGPEAEAGGLLGYGSSLIYSNSTVSTPTLTVLLRRASGAGYYAQAGLPFQPLLQLATPMSRLAVMEGRTLAMARFASHLDDDLQVKGASPEERATIERRMEQVEARIEADMDPYRAASRMDVDEVITLQEMRSWLEAFAEMSYQASGARRIRNPRIWSLHDLAVVCASRR